MAENQYTLKLSASISQDEITKQLDAISKAYVFKMKVNLDDSQVTASIKQVQTSLSSLSGTSSPKIKIDTTLATESLEQLRSQIEKTLQAPVTSKMKFDVKEGVEQAASATLTYKNAVDEVITETYKWVQADETWAKTHSTELDDTIKKTQQLLAEHEALSKEIQRYSINANSFLEKAKNMSQNNPQVRTGTDLANQMKALIQYNEETGLYTSNNITALSKLNDQLRPVNSAVGALGKSTQTWGQELKIAISRTITWATGIGLVYGALNQLKEGIAYIKELNGVMNDIQVVTGMSNEDATKLAQTYNNLAISLGVQTKAVADSSVTWLRQGKSIQEATELARNSMMMAKLGDMESADASQYLTSIINGFKLEAKDTAAVLDKLTAVDNATATSIAGLAEAMSHTSNVAQQEGVSMEQLVSWIATVASVTQRSASTVGTAFQSMFSRIQNIKLGKLDEEGASINDTEKALKRVGIALRDSEGQFRNTGVVIDEIAQKWREWDTVTQQSVAQAIAGTRQREQFLVLMNNYGQALELQKIQADSAGLAMQRYGIYLDSIEAHSNKLTATWEKMWSKSINDSTIKFVIDLTTGFLTLVNSAGGLIPVLWAVISALIVFNAQTVATSIGTFINGIKGAIASLMALGTTAVTTGATISASLGILSLIISGIVIAYNSWSTSTERAMQRASELKTEVEGLTTSLKNMQSQKDNLGKLGNEFEALRDKANKSNEEQQRFTEVQNQIKEILPQVNGYYDEQGNYILSLNTTTEKLIKLKQQELDVERKLLNLKAKEEIKAQTDAYKAQIKELDKMQKLQEVYKKSPNLAKNAVATYGGPEGLADKIEEQQAKIQQSIILIKSDYASMDEDTRKAVDDMLQGMDLLGEVGGDSLQPIFTAGAKIPQTFKSAETSVKSLSDTLKDLKKSSEELYGITDNVFGDKFNYDDVQKLLELNEKYLNDLTIEGGRIKVNTDALRKDQIAAAEDALQKAKNALALDKNNVSLQKNVDLLTNVVEQTKKAIPVSKQFVEAFEGVLGNAVQAMGGVDTSGMFGDMANQIVNVSEQFKNGEITHKEYFDKLHEELKDVDFEKVFKGNTDAAQLFFTGLSENSTQALGQLTKDFDSGQISLGDFEGGLTSLTSNFGDMGKMVEQLGSSMGMTPDQINQITQANDNLSASIANLSARKDADAKLEAMRYQIQQGSLEAGTEEYNQWADAVAAAYDKAGASFTDYNGKVYSGHDDIQKYLEGGTSNFMSFAKGMAQQASTAIEAVVHNMGYMLKSMGDAISGFHGTIKITPTQVGRKQFEGNIMGEEGNAFDLPEIAINIGGEDVGKQLSALGESLIKWKAPSVDEGLFALPGTMNQIHSTAGKAADGVSQLGKAIGDAGKASDKLKNQQDALKILLDMVINMIKQEKQEEIDNLKDQENAYKKIIDKRKELLDEQKKEADYNDEQADKQKKLADLQNELLELQGDDSEEAKAQRLKLEEEIANQTKDIQKDQRDHSIDEQKDALDQEYENFKEELDQQISEIEKYLKETGQIAQDAMQMINQGGDELYNNLMEWNRLYGDGMDSTVIKAWSEAYDVLDQFRNSLGQIDFESAYNALNSLLDKAQGAAGGIADAMGSAADSVDRLKQAIEELGGSEWDAGEGITGSAEISAGKDLNGNGIIGYDSGGLAGGTGSRQGRVLADLMSGELTITPNQQKNFFEKILPSLMNVPQVSSNISSGLQVGKLFEVNVQGNLDQSVMPKLEEIANKMFEKINNASFMQGITRNAKSFSI